MRSLALLFAAVFALSACDGGDPSGGDGMAGADMRGAAGAAGTTGAAGAGGAGGYVPDPAPTCDPPAAGAVSTLIVCDNGGGNAPTFNATGTQCYSCPGYTVPDTGCAVRLPTAIAGGQVIHGPRDVFCPFTPCDPTLCHVK